MLHMDIVKERLEREYDIQTIFTIPNVVYLVRMKSANHEAVKTGTNIDDLIKTGHYKYIVSFLQKNNNPEINLQEVLKDRLIVRSGGDMPPNGDVAEILEPIAEVEVV